MTALPSTDVNRVTLRLVDPNTNAESSTGNDYEFYLTDAMGRLIAFPKTSRRRPGRSSISRTCRVIPASGRGPPQCAEAAFHPAP